jgi:uncharacterized protein
MTQPLTPREVFHQLVQGVAERRWDDVLRLYADDTFVEHPLDPLGAPPLRGRAALRDHFRAGGDPESELRLRPSNITVHETTDPEVIVAEFEYHATLVATGETQRLPCVFVMRIRDGQIVTSRDYAPPPPS